MREVVREFVRICVDHLDLPDPIYEFGAFQVEGQEGFADMRPLFAGKQFVGTDRRPGTGVDVILDLHAIDLPEGSVGTALILDTLEHVERPRRAMQEIYRVLRPEGVIVVVTVMNYPIHDYPSDYWRFTPAALSSLLAPWDTKVVTFAGAEKFPHTVAGVGIKSGDAIEEAFVEAMRRWQNTWM